MRTDRSPAKGARGQAKASKDPGGRDGTAPGKASQILGLNEHERRKAEMLALTGALLSLTARSSTGVTASAFAAASLIVVLTAAVLWSVITRAPNVPPAAPPLEIATRGIPEAASGSDPFKLVDAQPESTASVPLAKVQGASVEQPSEPAHQAEP